MTYLDKCDMIFVSYGVYDAEALFQGEKAPLDKNDKRIRRIPFYIRRPTFSETKRISSSLLNITFLDNSNLIKKSNITAAAEPLIDLSGKDIKIEIINNVILLLKKLFISYF